MESFKNSKTWEIFNDNTMVSAIIWLHIVYIYIHMYVVVKYQVFVKYLTDPAKDKLVRTYICKNM